MDENNLTAAETLEKVNNDARRTGEEVGKGLALLCNSYSREMTTKAFVKEITERTHRTLQQQIMKMFLEVIFAWAKQADSGDYDGRNEATVKMAQRIREALGDDVYLPFI